MAGVTNPTDEAVKKAVTKEEMARHCRCRTRGEEETTQLIELLMTNMSTATDALGVLYLRKTYSRLCGWNRSNTFPYSGSPWNSTVYHRWRHNEGWSQTFSV